MTQLARSPYGRVEHEGNELLVISDNSDPPKVRCRAPAASGVKGTYSFDTQRQDGRYEEIGWVMGKQDERSRDNPYDFTGQVDINVRRYVPGTPDDPQFIKVLECKWDGIHMRVPLIGVGASSGQPDRMTSGNGRFVTVQQDDGNFVTYDRTRGEVGTPAAAVWASGAVL